MATKINLLTTLAALLIAAAGVMTFEACKNNKSINPLSTADLAKTAPIASKSLLTGGMHYYIDVDKLQKGINSYFENRSDNIVVESFEIVEADSTEYNKNGLRFTTIDIDNETSTTTLLYDDFIRIMILSIIILILMWLTAAIVLYFLQMTADICFTLTTTNLQTWNLLTTASLVLHQGNGLYHVPATTVLWERACH